VEGRGGKKKLHLKIDLYFLFDDGAVKSNQTKFFLAAKPPEFCEI